MVNEGNRKWFVAITCGLTCGLILLDETVVGVALPVMGKDLAMSSSASHWVVSAYLLTFAALALVAGRVADDFGLRRVFCAGAVLFGAMSALCAAADTGAALIAARAVQGIGAAIVFPVAFAIVGQAFPRSERATALGVTTTIAGAMLAMGPLVGGALTSFVSWRYIFLINVPIIAIAIAGVLLLAKPSPRKAPVPLDLKGLVLLVPALCLFVFAIMEGPTWAYGTPALVAVVVLSLALIVVFLRVERAAPAPLVDMALYRIPVIAGASLLFFAGQFAKIMAVVFVPLFLQHELGYSPVLSGLVLAVAVVPSPFIALRIGRMSDQIGPRKPALMGIAVATAATLALGVALTLKITPLLVIALFVWGLSLQAVLVAAPGAITRAMPHHRQGEAGGISVAARVFGAVLGMSAASATYMLTDRYDMVLYAALPLMLLAVWVGHRTMEHEG